MRITKNTSDITAVKNTTDRHTAQIADHEVRITKNASDIVAVKTTVDGHTTELADHEVRITKNTTDIASIDRRTTGNTTNITNLTNTVNNFDNRITGVQNDVAEVKADVAGMKSQTRRNTEGIAMAFAMAGNAALPTDKRLALSAGWGYFDSSNALALGLSARVSRDAFLSAGLAVGVDTGEIGGRAGVTVTW